MLERHMRVTSKPKAAKPGPAKSGSAKPGSAKPGSGKPASAKPKRRAARRPPPAARSYHHGDLRRVLIDAASQLAEEGGAEAVSVREAARREERLRDHGGIPFAAWRRSRPAAARGTRAAGRGPLPIVAGDPG